MKQVSLIKKIEYQKNSSDIYPVTFDLACEYDRESVKKVYNLIKDKKLLGEDYLSLGKNSFTIKILLDNIPSITGILTENGLPFFGIYVLYDNFLEMKENE